MEKQLSTVAYWIGIISTVLALITRLLAVFGVFVSTSASGKIPITYRSFLNGAILALYDGYCQFCSHVGQTAKVVERLMGGN